MGQQLWSWEAVQFEKIDKGSVRAEHAASAWHVAIETPDRAWGYRIALPEEAQMFIMWRASITVEWVNGAICPGLAYFLGSDGIEFQVDALHHRAELRRVLHTMQTQRVASFGAPAVEAPFDIKLEFNALTKVLVGMINDTKVCQVKIPFRTLPDIDAISDIEILTTTPSTKGTAGGTVSYGQLNLQCE